jgi:hypothetical protein
MVKMNLNTMVKNLRMPVTAKQVRFTACGNLTDVRILSAILSHAWRCVSPGSPDTESDPEPRFLAATAVATRGVKRAGRLAASRLGSFSVTSRIGFNPIACLPSNDSRDYLSNGYREAQRNRIHGPIPPYSRGK